MTGLERSGAHSSLDSWLDLMHLYNDAASDDERKGWARALVADLANFAGAVCGEKMLTDAYGDADPADPLTAVAARLSIASNLFGSLETAAEGSLLSVAAEARAVASGDEPKLFARRSGERVTHYRVALTKLRALEWDAYLTELGIKGSTRHASIALAFGHDWDTISRWGARSVAPVIGDDKLKERLRQARLLASSGFPLWGARRGAPWIDALNADGKRFKSELGFRAD
jgi:hypothetical protein